MKANHEELKIALESYAFETIARIPAESELRDSHQFSARFERRMRRLIRKLSRKQPARSSDQSTQSNVPALPALRKHKKLLAAAVILAILISLFSISAAREAVIGFFVHVYESFSTIVFDRDPASTTSTGIADSDALLPDYIPEGFTLKDKLVTDQLVQIDYTNIDHDHIVLTIQLLDMTQLMINTESVQQESIKIANESGIYYTNKGISTVVWQNGPYAMMLSGKIDKEPLLKMAESTNRLE